MKEMSTVEILKIWKDGVTFMEKGNYEEALKNFMALEGRTDSSQQLITSGRNLFNIGQMYLALGRMEMAAQVWHITGVCMFLLLSRWSNNDYYDLLHFYKAFEESIAKDPMMAIAHYTLGSVNLALDRWGRFEVCCYIMFNLVTCQPYKESKQDYCAVSNRKWKQNSFIYNGKIWCKIQGNLSQIIKMITLLSNVSGHHLPELSASRTYHALYMVTEHFAPSTIVLVFFFFFQVETSKLWLVFFLRFCHSFDWLVIGLRQILPVIILLINNWTPASRSSDFVDYRSNCTRLRLITIICIAIQPFFFSLLQKWKSLKEL